MKTQTQNLWVPGICKVINIMGIALAILMANHHIMK